MRSLTLTRPVQYAQTHQYRAPVAVFTGGIIVPGREPGQELVIHDLGDDHIWDLVEGVIRRRYAGPQWQVWPDFDNSPADLMVHVATRVPTDLRM